MDTQLHNPLPSVLHYTVICMEFWAYFGAAHLTAAANWKTSAEAWEHLWQDIYNISVEITMCHKTDANLNI